MRDTESRDIGRGRSRLPVGNPMQDSIQRPWDYNLSQRQDTQPLSHLGAPGLTILII